MDKFFSNKLFKLLSFLLALLCLLRAWNYGQESIGVDFYQFWVVGQKITQEKEINIYSDNVRGSLGSEFLKKAYDSKSLQFILAAESRNTLATYSTPFLYSIFSFFSSKDYSRAYTIYQFFCMACMAFAIIAFNKLLGLPFVVSLLFLAFFTSCFEPYLSDVRVANVNQVQLGLLVLFLWFQKRYSWKGRYFLGGIVLGSSIMFKPNLVFVFLILSISWLIGRQFKKIVLEYAGIAVSVISALIFSSIMFGSAQCWLDWLKAGIYIPTDITPIVFGNYSLVRVIFDWFGIDITKYLIAGLVGVTALFIWGSSRKSTSNSRKTLESEFLEDTQLVGIGCLIYLLSAPLVWLHYYILAIPAAIFILRPIDNLKLQISKRSAVISRNLGILTVILLSLNPIQVFFGFKTAYYAAVTVIIGGFLLFILSARELKNRSEAFKAE